MPSLGARSAALLAKLAHLRAGEGQAALAFTENAIAVARAVLARELIGEATSLRQLHLVTDLTQAAALRAAGELERSEMLSIARKDHDALDSKIALTPAMRTYLTTQLRPTSA